MHFWANYVRPVPRILKWCHFSCLQSDGTEIRAFGSRSKDGCQKGGLYVEKVYYGGYPIRFVIIMVRTPLHTFHFHRVILVVQN